MQIAFISDLHLSANTQQENQLFYRLLNKLVEDKFDSLYILGDFFDYWLGDDDMNDFAKEMIANLKTASSALKIYFLHGNHDFAVGKVFAKQTGITLIDDMSSIYTGKHKILFSHGDTFCSLDVGYHKMKRIIRNPIVLFILRKLPLSIRYKIKALMEKGSQSANTKMPKPPETYNVVDETIIQYANKFGADIVIHGHTHHPGEYEILADDYKLITRYETPDWEDHPAGSYLVYQNHRFYFEKI